MASRLQILELIITFGDLMKKLFLLWFIVANFLNFSNIAFADSEGHPLLKDTPQYVCKQLILGARYGKPMTKIKRSLFEALLGLRYDIKVKGLDEILAKGNEGIKFYPNHSGPVDPIIFLSAMTGLTNVRPVMSEDLVQGRVGKIIRKLVGSVNAFLLPNPATGGTTAGSMAQSVFREVVNATNNGDNVVLWPAGKIQNSEKEKLGNASAVEGLTKADPEGRIVLVRERGIWGSSWTRGFGKNRSIETGAIITRGLAVGIATLIANGFILTPKRTVTLEFFEPTDFPRQGTAAEINAYMEKFYNDPEHPEVATRVRRFFWQTKNKKVKVVESELKEDPTQKGFRETAEVELPPLDKDIADKLLALSKTVLDENITLDSNLIDSGLESITAPKLLNGITEIFNIQIPDKANYKTLRDLGIQIKQAQANIGTEEPAPEKMSEGWEKNPSSAKLLEVLPSTSIAEALVKQALSQPDKVISEDKINKDGSYTYSKLLLRAVAMSSVLEKIDGNNLGILLPSSAGGTAVYLASHLAGKVPTYVNFTSHPDEIVGALDSVNAKKILTSRAAIKEISKTYDMAAYFHRFIYLEDLKPQILKAIPLAWLKIHFNEPALLAETHRTPFAVIIFTSGTTGVPKAVGLTHENILSNIGDIMELLHLTESDRMFSYLPAFHSFGHIVMAMALSAGLPTFYYPKPQDSGTIANLLVASKPTLIATVPDFLVPIANRIKGQLPSLKYIFTGAARLKESQKTLFQMVFNNAEILEGYGATELSPVAAANPVGRVKFGTIGKLLASFQGKFVNPETFKDVQPGQPGLLLLRGPSVFPGYLNASNDGVFVDLHDGGDKYFNTHDIVTVDSEDYITYDSRDDDVVKRMGERISVPSIDAKIDEFIEPMRPKDSNGKPVKGALMTLICIGEDQPLVLFTTLDVTLGQIQRYQRSKSTPGSQIVTEVRRVPEIPMAGTGKANRKIFKKLLKDEAAAAAL